tara:strand:- start:142 stop:450 length:309 start_codon:yes stop_codon:yes gene_type:complete
MDKQVQVKPMEGQAVQVLQLQFQDHLLHMLEVAEVEQEVLEELQDLEDQEEVVLVMMDQMVVVQRQLQILVAAEVELWLLLLQDIVVVQELLLSVTNFNSYE